MAGSGCGRTRQDDTIKSFGMFGRVVVGEWKLAGFDLHRNSRRAPVDALATALYVMGLEQGMDWARRHQIHAIFILEDGRIFEVRKRDGQSN